MTSLLPAFQLPQQRVWQNTTIGFCLSPPVRAATRAAKRAWNSGAGLPSPAPASQIEPGMETWVGSQGVAEETLSGFLGASATSSRSAPFAFQHGYRRSVDHGRRQSASARFRHAWRRSKAQAARKPAPPRPRSRGGRPTIPRARASIRRPRNGEDLSPCAVFAVMDLDRRLRLSLRDEAESQHRIARQSEMPVSRSNTSLSPSFMVIRSI